VSRYYSLAPSVTEFIGGHYVVRPTGPPLIEFIAAESYRALTDQVTEATRLERLHLSMHGGEVSTWVDGKCIGTTIGQKRAVQQSIINTGEACDVEETVRRAVAVTETLTVGAGEHSGDDQGGTRTLDQGRVHHPGQQVLFEVVP
jgi:hypothetical protein